jgi:ABC-type dipeptide/oligopeptide/nickel transport system ATPase component
LVTPLLKVTGLRTEIRTRSATVQAVRNVSFSIAPGETVGLVGESGCGKSMTGMSLMRLLPPGGRIASGGVKLDGKELTTLSESDIRRVRGNSVSMIFQDPMTSLNPTMTVGDQLLIADEPTTALDVTIQGQILTLLDRLKDELHMSMLLITHDLGVIAGRADRVMVMYAGEIVESSDTGPLFTSMRHPYTQALFEAMPPLVTDRTKVLYSIPACRRAWCRRCRGAASLPGAGMPRTSARRRIPRSAGRSPSIPTPVSSRCEVRTPALRACPARQPRRTRQSRNGQRLPVWPCARVRTVRSPRADLPGLQELRSWSSSTSSRSFPS